jgi:DNA-binding MarR family transcriptional regulator
MLIPQDVITQTERVSDQFARLMSRSLGERIIEELDSADVTPSQLEALHHIARHDDVTVGDIASGLEISYPSATNMVHRLEKKGLVEKLANPKDRRAVRLRLSEDGAKVVGWLDRERSARFALVLEGMDEWRREEFLRCMADFILAALNTDVARPDELCLRCGYFGIEPCPIRVREGRHVCR